MDIQTPSPDEYDEMDPSPHMDAMVELLVFGNKVKQADDGRWLREIITGAVISSADQHTLTRAWVTIPAYSAYMYHATTVLDWMAERGVVRISNGDGDSYDCDFFPDNLPRELRAEAPLGEAHAQGDTWAHAICRAALASVSYTPEAEPDRYEEALNMLAQLEWSAPAPRPGTTPNTCPFCGGMEVVGHEHWCKLGKVLYKPFNRDAAHER